MKEAISSFGMCTVAKKTKGNTFPRSSRLMQSLRLVIKDRVDVYKFCKAKAPLAWEIQLKEKCSMTPVEDWK